MTIGQKIKESRATRKMTNEALAEKIGISPAAVWKIENDKLAGGPSAEIINLIADALEDNGIRLLYLENDPVFQQIIPRIFPELNNIRTEPSIVFSRFADEAEEAAKAARNLSQLFAHADPRTVPGFDHLFAVNMEQIVDVERCSEILMTALIVAGVMTESDRRNLYNEQQKKCEAKGHHRKKVAA